MVTSVSGSDQVQSLLANLRDAPVDTQGAADTVLGSIYAYLMQVPPDATDNTLHWFCGRAEQLTVDAATFLIRLHAYNSSRVNNWKEKLQNCLSNCAACVKARQAAKTMSRHTYFGAFTDNILEGFYQSVDEWELSVVLDVLHKAHLNTDLPSASSRTLIDAPLGIVYLLFCNLSIVKDPRVLAIVHARTPAAPILEWPPDPPPVALFLLAMTEKPDVRRWAKLQISRCQVVPIPRDQFVGVYEKVLNPAVSALVSTGQAESLLIPETFSRLSVNDNIRQGEFASFPFATDATALWSGFTALMRLLPPELMSASKFCNVDLRHVVIGHLHDTEPQFTDVLHCLMYLLKRRGKDLWSGEGAEYPQIVFDAVKDNPLYVDLFRSADKVSDKPWFLNWFFDFLNSIWELSVFGDVLAKVVDFMCEELQHERFGDARQTVMAVAMQLLLSIFRKSDRSSDERQQTALLSVLDIHAAVIVSVAFERSYLDKKWNNARSAARSLIKDMQLRDNQRISLVVTALCKYNKGSSTLPAVPTVRQLVWKNTYKTVQPSDSDGIDLIIAVVAGTAHMYPLNKKAFLAAVQKANKVELLLDEVNRCLTIFRDGFLGASSIYADYNTSSSVLDLIRRPGVVKNIMALMLCPIDDVQVAAQAIIGQAFDVDVRLDCFRALLENVPSASLRGIIDFLETFVKYVTVVPEACSLSKSLVRCLTDVIEVLCSSPDGLLHNSRFLRGEEGAGLDTDLLQLWHLMTKAIAVIFRLTPSWAPNFENEEMTVWMRDALIFGRDMIAQRRVIERGVLTYAQTLPSERPSKKLSRVGKQMMNGLQDVLPELARWLRLTDEELLHQSFALLQSLLDSFRETGLAPAEAGTQKLHKFIEDARKKDSKHPQTRLDTARLSELEDTLAFFESDDEVQIISHTPASRNIKASKAETDVPKHIPKPVKNQAPAHTSAAFGKGTAKTKEGVRAASLNTQSSTRPGNKSSTSTISKIERRPVPATLGAYKRADKGPKFEGSSVKPPPSESSSSEESDEEGDEDSKEGGLAALGKLQLTPKIKKNIERRQVKILDVATTGMTARHRVFNAREEAHRTALRLKPDVTSLHRTLLSWNYDHEGLDPPIVGDKLNLNPVPDRFLDYAQYRSIFEPLLISECWAQILQSKQETVRDVFECRISSRGFIDDWIDLDISILGTVRRDWSLAETDIVLLRHPDRKKCILGKTQSYKALPHGVQATVRCYLANGVMDPGLQVRTTWRLNKVFSLSTLHREYAALMALPYYDSFDTILHPRLPIKPLIDLREIKQAEDTYKVNEPQAVAILSSLKADGFTLIQGPPGTGKTSTICGLVQAFLSGRPRPTAVVHPGRSTSAVDKGPIKKVLLCAPSNAAVDEIAHRLKEGAFGSGHGLRPKVVRVGNEKSVNISVKDITLDSLVDQKLNSDGGLRNRSGDASNEIAVLRAEIESVKRQKQQKQDELSTIRDNAARTIALEDEIRALNSRRMSLTQQFDRMKDKQKSDFRTLDATRRKFRAQVLLEADVICGTLSGAGHEILEQCDFDMVIIDEAAQAIELSSLIPLKYRCRRCIMVGDPQQLPPTVLSQEASKYLYNQSLFVRLQKQNPDSVHLLSIQYRMHPEISQLPSHLFYQGRLHDGPDMDVKTNQPWQSHPKFGTYRFFNVGRGQEEEAGHHSLMNKAECQAAVALYGRLRQEFSTFDFDFRVGLVSMYRAQIAEMRRTFVQRFGPDIVGKVDFNTVDGFQGQEKDIIILSCVRAGPGLHTIGFLSDTRRMNVALTRAKSSLFVLGHAPTLERSDNTWRKIVADARSRSCLIDIDYTYFTSPNSVSNAVLAAKPMKGATRTAPLPDGLLTPGDFKSTPTQIYGSTKSDSPGNLGNRGLNQSFSDNVAKPLDQAEARTGQKRRMEQPLPKRPAMAESNNEAEIHVGQKRRMDQQLPMRPAPTLREPSTSNTKADSRPPVKRPKPPTSIFIPKPTKR